MITLELLENVFEENGPKYFEYLSNKNRGGTNNQKGNTFENFFTLYKIAEAFNKNIDPENILFSSQTFCFVDDLVIEQTKGKIHRFYQIKDVANLEWNNRPGHSIKEDFISQREIYLSIGIDPYLRLVVSNKDVYDHLISSIDEDIRDFIQVVNFETATSLNNLIRKNDSLRKELFKMCALNNPSADKLNTLGAILLGAWDSTDKRAISLKDLLDIGYRQNPHYIKGSFAKISGKLEGIFKDVDGFSYELEAGFLKWSFKNTDEGVLQYRIGSFEFEQWENDVFNAIIKTFEDLELFLAS